MPRPIRAPFTIPYGAAFGAGRDNGKRSHHGTDYHTPVGTPIYGVQDGGRVASIGYDAGGYGHYVIVVYPGGVQTLDAHMRERSWLTYGFTVNSDTIVGFVGLSGSAAWGNPPGSHDHAERRHNGALVDPESVYGTQPAGGGGTPITSEGDITMRVIRNPAGAITLVGELRYTHIHAADWPHTRSTWGDFVQLGTNEYNAELTLCNQRYAALQAGLKGTTPPTPEQIAAKVKANIAADMERLADDIAEINATYGGPTLEEIRDASGAEKILIAVNRLAEGEGMTPEQMEDLRGMFAQLPTQVREAIIKD